MKQFHKTLDVPEMLRKDTRFTFANKDKPYDTVERSISSVYPVIDTDLARDNIENDIPAADLQDL